MKTVFSLLLSATPLVSAFQFPFLDVSGSHFDVGQAIGKQLCSTFSAYVTNASTSLVQQWIPFSQTDQGQELVQGWNTANQKAYPQYFEELQGMNAGCPEISLEIFQLMTVGEEISDYIGGPDAESLQCSDIHVRNSDFTGFGHNEDNDWSSLTSMFLLKAEFDDGSPSVVVFSYPATLFGTAFGFNSAGLAFSENAVFPRKVYPGFPSRSFVARDLYSSHSFASAIEKLTHAAVASGASFNIGSVQDQLIFNIELNGRLSSVHAVGTNYSHFNMYKHLNVSQYPDTSTYARQVTLHSESQDRADEFPVPADPIDIATILGDTENTSYPIYRNGAPPDTACITLATGIFNLSPDQPSLTLWFFFINEQERQPQG